MPPVPIMRERVPAIIFDVDGTLCDVRSLRHYVEREAGEEARSLDFQSFHGYSIDAPAHERVARLYKHLARAGYAILIVTGREERWAFLTSLWLAEHGLEYQELVMRPKGDFRADSVIKREISETLIRRWDVRLVVDDRLEILEIWQRHSIPTIQVDANGRLGEITWGAEADHDQDLTTIATQSTVCDVATWVPTDRVSETPDSYPAEKT